MDKLIVFLINIPSKIVQFIFLQTNENISFQEEKFLDFCGEGQSIVFTSFTWICFFKIAFFKCDFLWASWERKEKRRKKALCVCCVVYALMKMCSVLFTGIAQVECVMISVVMAADVLEILLLIWWVSLESKSCILFACLNICTKIL